MSIFGLIVFLFAGAFMGWLLAPMIRGDSHSKLSNIIVGGIGGLLGYQYVLGLTSANLYLTIATAMELMLFIAFFVEEARDS